MAHSTRDLLPEARVTGKPAHLASLREMFGIDLRTLALFRVGLGILLLVDLALRARDLSAHYTDAGIVSRTVQMAHLDPGAFSFHFASGSVWFEAVMFAVAGIAAWMLLIGYRTRPAAVIGWALLLSVQNRNTIILSGEDNLLLLLTFWAMFLPLGARFSVDAALDRRDDATGNRYLSVATAGLLIQGASMYFFSALLKSDAKWIPDGTAVHYALQLDYFATPLAHWLRQFPDLLQGLTYYVWCLEAAAPLLLFSPFLLRPLRAALIPMLMTMHLGFALCLEIGIFSFVSILMNATFIPGWMWESISRRANLAGSSAIQIYYDRDCGFCLRACRLLKVFLVLPGARISPAQDDPFAGPLLELHNSWVVRRAGGPPTLKWDAVRLLVAASPLFSPAARILAAEPLRTAGDRLYVWIAANRGTLGILSARLLPWREVRTSPGRFGTAASAAALAFVCLQNVSTLPGSGIHLPETLRSIRQAVGLYQFWTMFAPYPEATSAWPVIVGRLRDGTIVDVYNRREGAPDWEKPRYVSTVFENHRWRKFLSRIEDLSYERPDNDFIRGYGRWLCREWNRDAVPGRELAVFTIHFQVEWTQPPGEKKNLVRRQVWSHDCFG